MGQQSKNIDNLFKDELGSYAETPPPMAWDALEKRLDKIPPGGGLFNPGKGLYIVMVSSLLLLSISVAKKLYVDHIAYLSSGLQSNIPGKQLSKNRPVSDVVNTQKSGNSSIISEQNTQNQIRTRNNIVENIKTNENIYPPHKRINPVYNKLSTVKALKNNKYSVSNYSSTQDISATDNEVGATDNILNIHNFEKSAEEGKVSIEDKKDYEESNDKPKPGPAPDKPKNTENVNGNANPKMKTTKQRFIRFEAGIKAGYEGSFENNGSKKIVASPYLQYNLSKSFSIMIQPAIKKGTIRSTTLGNPQAYYKENNDSLVGQPRLDPYKVYTGEWYYRWNFKYTQSYDSIIKSFSFGGSYTEFELPALVKYNIAHGISIYGGVNLVYSQYMSIFEHTASVTRTKSDSNIVVLTLDEGTPPVAPPPPAPINQVLKYTGTEISNYKYPFQPTPSTSFRMGYMIGFTYEYQKRWLLDGLIQQTPMPANMQGGYNINSALSSTNFRFTLGYKLIK